MNTKEILEFLSVQNELVLIGSSANKKLKYVTDYDTQEMLINVDPKYVLNIMQQKFRLAQQSDHIYIIDLKAGKYKTVPIRWDYKTIMKGYQDIDGYRVRFIDVLNNDDGNVVKLDVIAYYDRVFHEFSCNYYFTEATVSDSEHYNSLLLDVEKYYFDDKYMKMLKRLYSYYSKANPKKAKKLETFFNSRAGLLNQLEHKVNVILDILELKRYDRTQVNSAIQQLKTDTPRPFKSLVKRRSLQKLSDNLHQKVNELVAEFVNKL